MFKKNPLCLLFLAALGAVLMFHTDASARLFGRRAARREAQTVQIPSGYQYQAQCVDANRDGIDDLTGRPCGPGQGAVTPAEFGQHAEAYIDPATGRSGASAGVRSTHVSRDNDGDGVCDVCGKTTNVSSSLSVDEEDVPEFYAAEAKEREAKLAWEEAVKSRKIAAIKRDAELKQARIDAEVQRKVDALERGLSLDEVELEEMHVKSRLPDKAEYATEECEDCD